MKHSVQRNIRESYNDSNYTPPENIEETHRPNKDFGHSLNRQKSDSKEINSLKSNGVAYTKPNDKANILNKQFQSAFTNLVPLKTATPCWATTAS